MVPTKVRKSTEERNGRFEWIAKETCIWELCPQTPGIYRFDANPSESSSSLGLSVAPNPSLVLARSRRSACFPAEAYPPLRSPVVYPQSAVLCNGSRKKGLIIAALSDMVDIRQ
jgi:hypothetical protein